MKKNEQNGTGTDTGTDTGTELSTGQVQDIVKRKRGSNWMREQSDTGGANMEPGDVSRYVRYAMASLDLPPIDISDPEQVKERIKEYFAYCAENDRKPQIVGMANWLGIGRDALNNWKRGEYRSDTHQDIIKRAVDLIEEMWVDFMQNGKINPAAGIFIAKNHLGYRDETQVVVTPNNPLQDLNADEARKRIMDGIPDDEGTVE